MKKEYLMLHHLQKNGLGDFSVPVIVVKNDHMGNDFAEFLINEKNYECSEKSEKEMRRSADELKKHGAEVFMVGFQHSFNGPSIAGGKFAD